MLCYEQTSSLRGRSGWGFVDPGSCGWSKCKILLVMPLCLIPAPAFTQLELNVKAVISVHAAVSLLCLMCGEALSDYCLIPITVLHFQDSAEVWIERWLRVCVLDIFHREWKEFLRNFAVCFSWLLLFFSHPQPILRTSFFTHGVKQEKKKLCGKVSKQHSSGKQKAFRGEGWKRMGCRRRITCEASASLRLFFLPFFLLSFSLQATRQSGCLLRSLFILNRAWRQSIHFHIYFRDRHLEWLI